MVKLSELYVWSFFPLAPSAPPQNVNGYPENHTAFHLEWSPPPLHDQNGVIEGYLVNVTENDTGLMFQTNTNQISMLFSSLHPDYTYCCQVTAVTVSEGPYSDPYCIRLHPGGKHFLTTICSSHYHLFFSSKRCPTKC